MSWLGSIIHMNEKKIINRRRHQWHLQYNRRLSAMLLVVNCGMWWHHKKCDFWQKLGPLWFHSSEGRFRRPLEGDQQTYKFSLSKWNVHFLLLTLMKLFILNWIATKGVCLIKKWNLWSIRTCNIEINVRIIILNHSIHQSLYGESPSNRSWATSHKHPPFLELGGLYLLTALYAYLRTCIQSKYAHTHIRFNIVFPIIPRP